jgi:hypothetical protein
VILLASEVWQARRAAHEERVDAWIGPHLRRGASAAKHPGEGFLFK